MSQRYLEDSIRELERHNCFIDAISYARELKSRYGVKGEIPRLYLKEADYRKEPAHVINAAQSFEEEGNLYEAIYAYKNHIGMRGEDFNRELGNLELKVGNFEKGIQYYQKEYKDPSRVIHVLETLYEKDISVKFPNKWKDKKKELLNEYLKYKKVEIQKQKKRLLDSEEELNKQIKEMEKQNEEYN